jgi:hypothetical protein
MVLTYPRFYVNGKLEYKEGGTSGYKNICALFIDGYGMFTFSLEPFYDAKPIGTIQGQMLQVQIEGLQVAIRSMYDIVTQKTQYEQAIPVYVKYDRHYNFGRLIGRVPEYQQVRGWWGGVAQIMTYKSSFPFIGKIIPDRMKEYALGDMKKYEDMYPNYPKPSISLGDVKIELGGKKVDAARFLGALFDFEAPKDDDLIEFRSMGECFSFSLYPFEGASHTAKVVEKEIVVETPKGLMRINSIENILKDETGLLWFKYQPPKTKQTEIRPADVSRLGFAIFRRSKEGYKASLLGEKLIKNGEHQQSTKLL